MHDATDLSPLSAAMVQAVREIGPCTLAALARHMGQRETTLRGAMGHLTSAGRLTKSDSKPAVYAVDRAALPVTVRHDGPGRPAACKGPPAHRDRPQGDAPAKRRCLCCGRQFASTGWGNRMCRDCRRRETEIAA